jgi:hypothetical protein
MSKLEREKAAGNRSVELLREELVSFPLLQVAQTVRDQWARNRLGIPVRLEVIEKPDVRISQDGTNEEDHSIVGYKVGYSHDNVIRTEDEAPGYENGPSVTRVSYSRKFKDETYVFVGVGYDGYMTHFNRLAGKGILIESTEPGRTEARAVLMAERSRGSSSITDSTLQRVFSKMFEVVQKNAPDMVVAAVQERIRASKRQRR